MKNNIPSELMLVLREFRTCEFTTISKRGTPVTWPVSARYLTDQGRFLLTTTIGYPQKAYNIRRNPRVSMLFSNPTGSGLVNPASVLVQGDAEVSDQIMTSVNEVEGLREYWLESIMKRQPAVEMIVGNPLMHGMMDWYYMRLRICVTPKILYWWPKSDFSQPSQKLEVQHVE